MPMAKAKGFLPLQCSLHRSLVGMPREVYSGFADAISSRILLVQTNSRILEAMSGLLGMFKLSARLSRSSPFSASSFLDFHQSRKAVRTTHCQDRRRIAIGTRAHFRGRLPTRVLPLKFAEENRVQLRSPWHSRLSSVGRGAPLLNSVLFRLCC